MPEENGYRKNNENRIVRENLDKEHKKCLQWRQVRVGDLPLGADAKFAGVVRRWADAVCYDGKVVTIIEAKMRPDPSAIGQLELYAQLLPKTPEFPDFHAKPIHLVLLTTFDDKESRALAESKGIEVVIYSPSWVKDYWKERLRLR